MTNISLFHRGEIELQRIVGEQHDAARVSQLIQNTIPSVALRFLRQQSIIWIGIEDNENMVWAFPLTGSPGFIDSNNGDLLEIALDEKTPVPGQWSSQLKKGKYIGCLVIELASRRRIRINGIITAVNNQHLQINVQHAYPNCPKYIRKRKLLGKPDFNEFRFISSGIELDERVKNIIQQSDTAFVASTGPNGADVSHRGGPKGFISYKSVNTITVPDYNGNGLFNTLGNFKVNPSGGILIVEFHKGYFVQMAGKINLLFDQQYPRVPTGGTNRYWQMKIKQWRLYQLQPNFKWEDHDFSPYNPSHQAL